MKIEDIDHQLREIKVDDKTKKALIKIIDLKTENDMKEVLQKMNSIEKSFAKQNQMILWVIGIATLILSAVMLYTKTK